MLRRNCCASVVGPRRSFESALGAQLRLEWHRCFAVLLGSDSIGISVPVSCCSERCVSERAPALRAACLFVPSRGAHSRSVQDVQSLLPRIRLLTFVSFLAVWRGYTPIVSALFECVRRAVAKGGFAFPVSNHQLKVNFCCLPSSLFLVLTGSPPFVVSLLACCAVARSQLLCHRRPYLRYIGTHPTPPFH
jgi:hypothetical protein